MALLTVACVKCKPDYGYRDVNRLQAMVKRHLTLPHRFICFTDDPVGVKCNTKKLPGGLVGWWAKLAMFRRGVLDGKVLYIDLDTLIVDSLDFIEGYSGDFAILRDFYSPEHYGSGVMLWNKAPHQVWDRWQEMRFNHPMGDQGWIESQVKDADRLQDLYPNKLVSYKAHCEEQQKIPDGAAIVCFHGFPKPENFDNDHWVSRIWKADEYSPATV